MEDNELFDLRALRLDWFRVQAYCSSGGVGGGFNSNSSKLNLFEHRQLASQLDTAAHHTRMVDYLDEMLVDTSDLSLFWYVYLYLIFFFILIQLNCVGHHHSFIFSIIHYTCFIVSFW